MNLHERYRYGKNGKGGITAELNKIGIKLDEILFFPEIAF